MNIALVNSEYPSLSGSDHGGITTYTLTLAYLLSQHGHNVHVLNRSGFHSSMLPQAVTFHSFNYIKNKNVAYRILQRFFPDPFGWEKGQARAVIQLITSLTREQKFDIVEFPEYGGLASFYPTSLGIPCVITFHTPSILVDKVNNIQPSEQRRHLYHLEAQAIARAVAYKCPSNALKKYVCNHYQLPSDVVSTVDNPFDSMQFNSIYRPPVNPSRFDILFSGRLEFRKGAEIILHTIKDILSISNAITLTIAGETEIPNAQNYRQAIERILTPAERNRVFFPGPLSRNRLLPLYCNSSLFLFPSLFENSPYALLEAMAAGLPVVASAGSGIEEIITQNENGLLFSLENRSELVTAIKKCYNDAELTQRLKQNALKTIEQKYNPDKSVREHCDFYQSVIDHNR